MSNEGTISDVSMISDQDQDMSDAVGQMSKRQAVKNASHHDPSKIKKETAPGAPDDEYDWVRRPGRQPQVLTKKQSDKIRAKEEKKVREVTKPLIDEGALPVIMFPIRIELKKEDDEGRLHRYEFTGNIAGAKFDEGVCFDLSSYRRVMQIGAAGFRCFERESGIEVMPQTLGRTFTATGQPWNHGTPLQDDHPEKDKVDASGKRIPKSEEGETQKEEKGKKEVIVHTRDGRKEPLVFDERKMEAILKVIPKLRPGHKLDWAKGVPDCRRLSALIAEQYKEEGFDKVVTKIERDQAWHRFNRDKLTDDMGSNSAFAIPLGNDASAMLASALAKNGARMLRQKAEEMGIEKPSKEGQGLIGQLVEAGITVDDAKKLL